MIDGRTSQRLRQEAWKRLSQEWKDDPEACFVFGFQAGLDAVAPRVEPPVTESGAGFESLPASVHGAWTPDDTAYRPGGLAQRKPLTDEEIWKFWWARTEVPEGEDDSMEAQFIAAVRAIEATYGIKE